MKLDEFLKLSDFEALNHSRKVSSDQAKQKAKQEYERFRRVIDASPTQVDKDLAAAVKMLKQKD